MIQGAYLATDADTTDTHTVLYFFILEVQMHQPMEQYQPVSTIHGHLRIQQIAISASQLEITKETKQEVV